MTSTLQIGRYRAVPTITGKDRSVDKDLGRGHRLALLLAAAFVGIAVIALASVQIASAGTIQGCVSDSNGQLRVVSNASECRKNEAPISWNTEGPPGPQGEPGDLHAFVATHEQTVIPPGNVMTEVARLSLDAGKYLLFAKVHTQNRDPQNVADVDCFLAPSRSDGTPTEPGESGRDFDELMLTKSGEPGDQGGMALMAKQDTFAPGPAVLYCRNSFASRFGVFIGAVTLTAIRVNALTATVIP